MNEYYVKINKTRGQPKRGSKDHVWSVFENGKEYICKHIQLNVPSLGELDESDSDFKIICRGFMAIDKETSTATINWHQ